jgi:3-oxoacyl-[acyl-carrier-protein] synthase II
VHSWLNPLNPDSDILFYFCRMKRVVITGMGVIAPNGNNIADFWDNVVNGRSAASAITRFNAEQFKTRFASQISNYDPTVDLDRNDIKRGDLYSQYALIAAKQAIADSGFDLNTMSPFDVGVILGSAQGGMETFEHQSGRVPCQRASAAF